jgi:hypothetical protein
MKYRKGKKARKIKYSDENLAVNIPGGHIQDRRSGMRNLLLELPQPWSG